MKFINVLSLVAILALSACQRDVSTASTKNSTTSSANPVSEALTGKPAAPTTCNPNAYTITLVSRTLVNGNWEWIWSVLNPNPGNGQNGTSQNMSHWGMQFGSCFFWSDVVGAAYSADGNAWTTFTPTYSVDPSQSCVTTPVLKFAFGTNGSAKSYYKLVLNKKYGTAQDFGYYKSGAAMPCCTFNFTGVGCPEPEDDCSFSQGFYFASPHPWTAPSVTVAGFSYTELEGRAIWNTSNMGGLLDSKKAFLQVAAIKLSSGTISPSSSIWTDVAICETWLATLGKLSPANLPTGNSAVAEAAGRIGTWITENHCAGDIQ